MELSKGQITLLKFITGKKEVTIEDYYNVVNNLEWNKEPILKHLDPEEQKRYREFIKNESQKITSDLSTVLDSLVENKKDIPTDMAKVLNDNFLDMFEDSRLDESKAQKYFYTNWKGVNSIRNIIPIEVSYGTTEYHKEPTNLLRAYDVDKKAERTFDMKFLVPLLDHETKPRSKDFNEKLYEKYIDSYEEMTGEFALEVLKEDHNGEPLESGSPTTDFAMFLINELELWQQMYYNDSEQNGYKLEDNYAPLGNFEL